MCFANPKFLRGRVVLTGMNHPGILERIRPPVCQAAQRLNSIPGMRARKRCGCLYDRHFRPRGFTSPCFKFTNVIPCSAIASRACSSASHDSAAIAESLGAATRARIRHKSDRTTRAWCAPAPRIRPRYLLRGKAWSHTYPPNKVFWPVKSEKS
jgi:hypothetical protein